MEQKISDGLHQISGYTGYRSKEDRRDDDRRVREAVAKGLDATVSTLTGVSAALADQRKLTHISAIERLVGSTRTLGDRVRTASYGYGGIFTDRSIDEFALDQLRKFDVAFLAEAKKLDVLADRLASSPEGPLDVDITEFQTELNRLGTLFDGRYDVVDTARPSKDAMVLGILEPTPAPIVSPIASLKIGDTLSILGDNFVVDGLVTLREPDVTVNLARVGEDKNGQVVWLIGGTNEQAPSARLSESLDQSVVSESGRAATANIASRTEKKEGVPAQYGYTSTTGNAVTFWYSIGDQTRSYSGTRIDDIDIEVYGQA